MSALDDVLADVAQLKAAAEPTIIPLGTCPVTGCEYRLYGSRIQISIDGIKWNESESRCGSINEWLARRLCDVYKLPVEDYKAKYAALKNNYDALLARLREVAETIHQLQNFPSLS
jgi:hypothetical protein